MPAWQKSSTGHGSTRACAPGGQKTSHYSLSTVDAGTIQATFVVGNSAQQVLAGHTYRLPSTTVSSCLTNFGSIEAETC